MWAINGYTGAWEILKGTEREHCAGCEVELFERCLETDLCPACDTTKNVEEDDYPHEVWVDDSPFVEVPF